MRYDAILYLKLPGSCGVICCDLKKKTLFVDKNIWVCFQQIDLLNKVFIKILIRNKLKSLKYNKNENFTLRTKHAISILHET